MGVTALGRGAFRQIWDEPKIHARVRGSALAAVLAPGHLVMPGRCVWAVDGECGLGTGIWAGDGVGGPKCRQASPPRFYFCWKTSLLRLCFFPSLFKFIWENFPGCSQRCHQPDSLCCSNKMAP